MNLSHKIRLYPTKEQSTGLNKALGCSRFTYNWALAAWETQYKSGLKPTANSLKKEFNTIKAEQFPWIYESPKDANQQAFADLSSAFQNFFKKRSKYPRFKKKNKKNSFYLSNDKTVITDTNIKVPLIGEIKLAEKLRFQGKLNNVRISKEANQYYASVSLDVENHSKPRLLDGITGIDLGLTYFCTTSQGEIIEAPKPLKKYLSKLRKKQRRHSKKKPGSKNRIKSAVSLAKLHLRIKNIRQDFLHKVTSKICSENQAVVVEDLDVSWMLANRRLARAVSDVGFHELRRQLTYKAGIYGTRVIVADRFFPSSKTCNRCGFVKSALALSERTFVCDSCGYEGDRDFNAAMNLYTLGFREIYACGQSGPTGLVEAGMDRCSVSQSFLST